MPTPDHASDIRLFNSAFELLKEWMDIEEADDFQPLGNAAVYKTSVVLWLMLFQRLNPNTSLKEAVEHFFTNAPRGKNANKRLRDGTLSQRSSSYSDSRKRLTLARAKVNYHWHKARWHALNAPGVTPSCLPTSFDLAPLALVSGRGGENAMGSCKFIGISSLACYECG